MKKKIIIVGAGFSGMTMALELSKRQFAVEIHEKSSRCGGLLGTQITPHGLAETAANGLLLTDSVEKLFAELDLKVLPSRPEAKKRYLFRNQPRRWPLKWHESLLLAGRGLFHLLTRKHFLRPHWGENMQEWGESRLGSAATKYLLAPGLQGIYAGRTEKLSASLILNPLFKKNRQRFRGTISAEHGMQELIDALEKKLLTSGVHIHFNSDFSIENVEDPIVIATSASSAAKLLKEKFPPVSLLLDKIQMNSIMTVTSFWDGPTNPYPGFGCLLPRSEGFRTLGVLMNQFIFTGRTDKISETYILGGATDPSVMSLSDEQVVHLLQEERKNIFGVSGSLLSCKITRWPSGLPDYNLELEKVLQILPDMDSVFLHGNYLGSIGLSKILERSALLADQIAEKYG